MFGLRFQYFAHSGTAASNAATQSVNESESGKSVTRRTYRPSLMTHAAFLSVSASVCEPQATPLKAKKKLNHNRNRINEAFVISSF